jgi:hypothetical protein
MKIYREDITGNMRITFDNGLTVQLSSGDLLRPMKELNEAGGYVECKTLSEVQLSYLPVPESSPILG